MEQIRKNPLAWAVAVMGGLTVVKVFFTDALPWYAETLGRLSGEAEWIAFGFFVALAGAAVYFGFQYARYRAALRKLSHYPRSGSVSV